MVQIRSAPPQQAQGSQAASNSSSSAANIEALKKQNVSSSLDTLLADIKKGASADTITKDVNSAYGKFTAAGGQATSADEFIKTASANVVGTDDQEALKGIVKTL